MKKTFWLFPILILLLTLAVNSTVSAYSFSITNNGSDSSNSIKAKLSKKYSFNQENTFSSYNNISVYSNTGDNSTSGNTGGDVDSDTGDIDSTITVYNTGSYNYSSTTTCCGISCEDDDPDPTPSATPSPTPSPTPDVCQEGPGWAGAVIEANQGTLKSGEAISDTERTNPDKTVGAADGSFFSLGDGGSIVLSFNQPVENTNGDDLSFHEVTNNRGSYPEEKIQVEVSQDGLSWTMIGEVTNNDGGDGVGYLDFDSTGFDYITHVRITDTTDYALHDDQADGYDLDAVDATNLMCE